jgi:hypothetical protein
MAVATHSVIEIALVWSSLMIVSCVMIFILSMAKHSFESVRGRGVRIAHGNWPASQKVSVRCPQRAGPG